MLILLFFRGRTGFCDLPLLHIVKKLILADVSHAFKGTGVNRHSHEIAERDKRQFSFKGCDEVFYLSQSETVIGIGSHRVVSDGPVVKSLFGRKELTDVHVVLHGIFCKVEVILAFFGTFDKSAA